MGTPSQLALLAQYRELFHRIIYGILSNRMPRLISIGQKELLDGR